MSAPTLMAPAADTAPPARRGRGRIAGATGAFWLFVGPFVIGLIIFVYVPIIWSVVLSFTRAQNTVTPGDWVGLQNYIDLLQPGPFLDSLITFTIFAAFIVPLTFALSLELALLLNQVKIMRAFFPVGDFLPTACSYVVASLVWKLSISNGVRFGLVTPSWGSSAWTTSPGWLPPARPGTGW
jgi:multiple sugar transport system permease protein